MPGKLTAEEIADLEARLKALPEPDLTDRDNPEWTEDDFARAVGPDQLSEVELAAFPRSRGRPKSAAPKAPISLRLDAQVVQHLRAQGAGWQTRVNDALAELIAAGKL